MLAFLGCFYLLGEKGLEEKQVEAGKVVTLSVGVLGAHLLREHLEKMRGKS